MSQLGEPFDWGNPWEGTEFEDIINELIKKTDENRKRLSKLEGKVESIQYDLNTFSDDTVRMVTDILRKRSEL
jgi:ubiquinone biosynthesis protein UbiJ